VGPPASLSFAPFPALFPGAGAPAARESNITVAESFTRIQVGLLRKILRRREPEKTVLYQVLQHHLDSAVFRPNAPRGRGISKRVWLPPFQ